MRVLSSQAVAPVILAVTLALGSPAIADTSSWSSGDQTTIPKLAPTLKKPAPAPEAQPNSPADMKTRIPSLVPATGDDAAYTAFDQGQYLTALKLAQDAAAKGEPQANTLIGRIYDDGLGVPKDERKAVEYFKRASDMGDVQGAFALGIAYAQGRGVKKDFRTAANFFEKAALTGNA